MLLRESQLQDLGDMLQSIIGTYELGAVRSPEEALELNDALSQRIWSLIRHLQPSYTPSPLDDDRSPVNFG